MNNKLLMALPLLAGVGCQSNSEPQKPNIIFIFADDMGYGDVSALNAEGKIPTPHLDKMVANGLNFTDAHTSSSVSTPSRYGALTGRYNWRSPLKENVVSGFAPPLILPGRETMASMLKKAGYATACIGKWHLGWDWDFKEPVTDFEGTSVETTNMVNFDKPIKNGPIDIGFDYFYGHSCSLDIPPYVYVENDMPTSNPTEYTQSKDRYGWWRKGITGDDFDHRETLSHFTDKTIDYIESQASEESPFFVYLPYPAPHTPILPSEEWMGKSGLNPYADYVMMLDNEVGRLMAALEKLGMDENTIVVFSADNACSPAAKIGELHEKGHYPNYIYRGHKADLFEGGHRVPCIVQWKAGIEAGTESHQTMCITDLYATFADIVGVPICDTEAEDSYNFNPVFNDPTYDTPIRQTTIHHSFDGEFAIRMGDWKLLATASSGGWSAPRPGNLEALKDLPPMQLYNLKTDPSETTNLVNEHPEIAQKLLNTLRKEIVQGRCTPGAPQHNEPDMRRNWPQLEKVFAL